MTGATDEVIIHAAAWMTPYKPAGTHQRSGMSHLLMHRQSVEGAESYLHPLHSGLKQKATHLTVVCPIPLNDATLAREVERRCSATLTS